MIKFEEASRFFQRGGAIFAFSVYSCTQAMIKKEMENTDLKAGKQQRGVRTWKGALGVNLGFFPYLCNLGAVI